MILSPKSSLVVVAIVLVSLVTSASTLTFPKDFVFGVANAPAQVEDGLDDIWLDWAKQGGVRAWTNQLNPNERLQFWNKPDVEIDLAQNLGVGAFRMGIDWGRVMPTRTTLDVGAMRRYHDTIRKLKAKKMKVMLTLWHHDVPKWVQESGGWHNPQNKASFVEFAKRMIAEFHGDVEWFVTFNEANVFAMMAYTTGAWPPGEKQPVTAMIPLLGGSSVGAIDLMADAHNEIYDWAHQNIPNVKLGLAHNMAHYTSKTIIGGLTAHLADSIMNWRLPNRIAGRMDFFGINYYGAEWFRDNAIALEPDEEYSDAGRAIDTDGLYDILKIVDQSYTGVPIILTENGIADANDSLRSAYILEHLAAIHRATSEGVPVKGYFLWTLTDNLEWSDGYCPKFGLVGVDRRTMTRLPRPSYYFYRDLIRAHGITSDQRAIAWQGVMALQGRPRPMCRATDGAGALDQPRAARFSYADWRFTK